MNEAEFLQHFRQYVDSFPSQSACARHLKTNRMHLNEMYNGKKMITEKVARKLGFYRTVDYVRVINYEKVRTVVKV